MLLLSCIYLHEAWPKIVRTNLDRCKFCCSTHLEISTYTAWGVCPRELKIELSSFVSSLLTYLLLCPRSRRRVKGERCVERQDTLVLWLTSTVGMWQQPILLYYIKVSWCSFWTPSLMWHFYLHGDKKVAEPQPIINIYSMHVWAETLLESVDNVTLMLLLMMLTWHPKAASADYFVEEQNHLNPCVSCLSTYLSPFTLLLDLKEIKR